MTLRPISHYSSARFDDDTRDLRGLALVLPSDEQEGRVHDLIVDSNGSVRYADIAMDGHHHLVPIGYLRAMPDSNCVRLCGMDAERLKKAPTRRPSDGAIDEETESELGRFYDSVDDDDRIFAGPAYRGHGWRTGEDREVDLLERMDDYEVADHSCDPRGWKVCDLDDRCLGEVDHLVGDTKTMKVSHLVVDIDDDLLSEDRLVLIPVGYAELEEDDENVRLRGIPTATLLDLPAYEEKKLSSDVLEKTHTTLRAGRTRENRYETPRFRDDALRVDERSLRAQRAEEKVFSDRKPVVVEAIVVRGRDTRPRTEESGKKRRSNGSSEQHSYA